MARGEVAAGVLLVFLLAVSDFTVSSLLLVKTLPVVINDQLMSNRTDVAAWASLPLLALVVVTALLLTRGRRVSAEQESNGILSVRSKRWGGAALWLGLLLGVFVPLGGCAVGALIPRGPQENIAPLGILWPAIAEGWPYLAASLRMAAGVALLAALAGALRVILWPQMRAAPLCWAALVLLALPGAFVASGFLTLQFKANQWDVQWFSTSSLVLSIGYLVRFIYLPLRLTEEGLGALEPSMLESAELAGHGRLSRGLTVALPMVWPHLLAAGALVFVFVLGELPLSQRLAPPGQTPVCLWLFNLQHYDYTERVFVLCLMLGATVLLGMLGAASLSVWWKREARGA
jgi:iron(III) transport system permease protein